MRMRMAHGIKPIHSFVRLTFKTHYMNILRHFRHTKYHMYALTLRRDSSLLLCCLRFELDSFQKKSFVSVNAFSLCLLHLFTVSARCFARRELHSSFRIVYLIYWSVTRFDSKMLGCIVSGRLVCKFFFRNFIGL